VRSAPFPLTLASCDLSRVGYLYGRFLEDNTSQVEFVYEPPQDSTPIGFTLLPDENAVSDNVNFFVPDPSQDKVEAIAALLELRRVGWLIAHPPREEGFFLSGNEIITAAELQLEAANGIADTPFVTVSVSLCSICISDPRSGHHHQRRQGVGVWLSGLEDVYGDGGGGGTWPLAQPRHLQCESTLLCHHGGQRV
jgi:hypothetical protein